MIPLKIFTGWDSREEEGWHVFVRSVLKKASIPIAFIPIGMNVTTREGTNAFTYSRFLVPWLCNYQGWALFVDGCDMLCRVDIAPIFEAKHYPAIYVVKHDYKTKFARKYVGTDMEADNVDYPKKNQSSVILWDCGHHMNRQLTHEWLAKQDGAFLHRFGWLPEDRIGSLDPNWNWLADEYGENQDAKILHWTAGAPFLENYQDVPQSEEWKIIQRGLRAYGKTKNSDR